MQTEKKEQCHTELVLPCKKKAEEHKHVTYECSHSGVFSNDRSLGNQRILTYVGRASNNHRVLDKTVLVDGSTLANSDVVANLA